MISDNVTLIVKAPNQQIEDQSIQCHSSWTVKQLKGHLSEVYPSKPRTEEQKIIYSGQLLEDTIILKDVLRTFENQIGHTMHLVCTNKRFEKPVPPKSSDNSSTQTQNDGLRRRHLETETVNRPETRQNDQNHNVEMQNYLSSFVNNYGRVPPYNYNFNDYLQVSSDPASMANHMLMMQQAYMQYMQQYANLWQANGDAAPIVQPTNPVNETPQPQPQPEQQPEEPEDVRRDWLDHIYAASRLAVLFSLVYLYSSPFRLLLVVMIAAAGYLHQVGFFRDLANNAEPRPQNQPQAENQPAAVNNQPQAENNQPRAENNQPQPENQPRAENEPENIQPGPENSQQMTRNEEQSLFAFSWMVFSTFFTSLIPEMNQ